MNDFLVSATLPHRSVGITDAKKYMCAFVCSCGPKDMCMCVCASVCIQKAESNLGCCFQEQSMLLFEIGSLVGPKFNKARLNGQ